MRGKKNKDLTRKLPAEAKYSSEQLAKFINYVMKDGKKTIAQSVVYKALEKIGAEAKGEGETKKDPLKIFEEAVKNVSPQVEVRSRRVGGANYQVPIPVSSKRQQALAFRWIIGAAKAKKGRTMSDKLADILQESVQNLGDAIKKRDDIHRMAEANKAFAHFARFRKKKK
ncbi:MAG: 30S ribosomal protein S7 [bacterium]